MFNFANIIETIVVAAITAFIGIIVYSRAINRKINSEAKHIDTENITIYASAANTLLEPLRKQLEETQKEAETLRNKVKELTRDISAQSLIVDELTEKLERANKRADYFQAEYERLAGLSNIRKPPSP